LLVKGVTPDIYYGSYAPVAQEAAEETTRLAPRAGLANCLSVFGSRDRVDANTAAPAVLAAVGLTPGDIATLVARRNAAPILSDQMQQLAGGMGPSANRLRLGGNTIFTFRATARPRLANGRLSDLRRTLAAQVRFMPGVEPVQILRWYDAAWSN
jgi:hypothetical protein